jgi:hypothetical protein
MGSLLGVTIRYGYATYSSEGLPVGRARGWEGNGNGNGGHKVKLMTGRNGGLRCDGRI